MGKVGTTARSRGMLGATSAPRKIETWARRIMDEGIERPPQAPHEEAIEPVGWSDDSELARRCCGHEQPWHEH